MTGEAQKAPEAYQKIILKAWKDEGFREALRADPRGVLQRELGTALPAELEIQVVEETPTKIYFVIPAMPPEIDSRELSEEELAAVAGGVAQSIGAQGSVTSFGARGEGLVAMPTSTRVAFSLATLGGNTY